MWRMRRRATLISVLLQLCCSVSTHAATGLEWLNSSQNADGSFANTPMSLATPVQSTAEVVQTYQILKLPAQSGFSAAFTYLNADTEYNSEYLARKIIINAQSGGVVGALINALLAHQNTDGGFGDQPGYASRVLDTAVALEVLAAVRYGDSNVIGRAVFFLTQQQQADGGFSLTSSNATSVYLTSRALLALQAVQFNYNVAANVGKAREYLRVPHHITQRGNRREQVFFTDDDRQAYLARLKGYAEKYAVDILAYCLMTNHVHLIAIPANEDSLEKVLKSLHMRYAQRLNRARHWKGHVWQGRFFSSALGETYLWAAMHYVERNPVRAKIVRKAENDRWSSASAHCRLKQGPVLTRKPYWQRQFESIGDWAAWLSEGDEPQRLEILRRNVEKGLPCGSEKFIHKLETLTGRALQNRPRGRPKRGSDE